MHSFRTLFLASMAMIGFGAHSICRAQQTGIPSMLAKEPPLHAEIKSPDGVPTLYVNGEPSSLMLYAFTGVAQRQLSHIPGVSKAGIHIYNAPISFFELLGSDNTAQFQSIDDMLRQVLEKDPDARMILRLWLSAPSWWYEANSDQRVQYAAKNPKDPNEMGPESAASEKWLKLTSEYLRNYIAYIEKSPYGKRVLGYHLAWGVTGEWHYYDFARFPDTGPAMTARFRQWLEKKYGPRPEWAAVQVPTLEDRAKSQRGLFRDPANPADRLLIDYYRCQHETVRDVLLKLCSTAKSASNRKKLVGAFYGYYTHMGHVKNELAEGGHLTLDQILESPDIDFLAGPPSYQHESRKVGSDGGLRGLTASVNLHGKMWLGEADEPTYLGCSQGVNTVGRGTNTPAGSISAMQRNFCVSALSQANLWWFDIGPKDNQGGLAGGWWEPDDLNRTLAQLQKTNIDMLKTDRSSAAQVAVIANFETNYYLAGPASNKDNITHPIANDCQRALYHSGVPFDLYSAGDLERLPVDRYKAVLFLDAFYLTDAQRAAIESRFKKENRTLIWVYAPGYVSENQLSAERLSEVIGITMREHESPANAMVSMSTAPAGALNGKLAVLAGLRQMVPQFGVKGTVTPVFEVNDSAAIPLGQIAGTGKTGLAVKQFDDWTSVYMFAPPMSPALLRTFFKAAGVHIYNEDGDVVYANAAHVAITGENGGKRTIRLPQVSDVVDVFSGQPIATACSKFSFDFTARSTRLFRITPNGSSAPSVVADSVNEFSRVQGQSGWFYGFYGQKGTPGSFQQYRDYGSVWLEGWSGNKTNDTQKTGGGFISASEANAGNIGGVDKDAVRRWVSDYEGPVSITGEIRKIEGGPENWDNGGIVRIYADGRLLYEQVIKGSDTQVKKYLAVTELKIGSTLDFAVNAYGNNGRDRYQFTAVVAPQSR